MIQHVLLQRLPRLKTVRSLYIHYIVGHPHGNLLDIQELALHILDLISLRLETELCYLAISNKCFEILERRAPTSQSSRRRRSSSLPSSDLNNRHPLIRHEDDDDEDDEDDAMDEEDEEYQDAEEFDSVGDSTDGESDDDWPAGAQSEVRLRLQEILFYEKITVFKARHMRL
jgi:hypothetical protein